MMDLGMYTEVEVIQTVKEELQRYKINPEIQHYIITSVIAKVAKTYKAERQAEVIEEYTTRVFNNPNEITR